MAITGKWPHCLSPDGTVAAARFDKWLFCLWINCCWSQQSVQIWTYLQLRQAGAHKQRLRFSPASAWQTSIAHADDWKSSPVSHHCNHGQNSSAGTQIRAHLLARWEAHSALVRPVHSQELSKTPLRYFNASLRDPRSKGDVLLCSLSQGICWRRQSVGIWWDSLPMLVTVSLIETIR